MSNNNVDLTAQRIAEFLQENPSFFMKHADTFSNLQVPHPYLGKALSLADRQVLTMRERLKSFEISVARMIANARENAGINDMFFLWGKELLAVNSAVELPKKICQSLADIFNIPDVTLRLWGTSLESQSELEPWLRDVDDDVRVFARSLQSPYCGKNHDLRAAQWLSIDAQSLAVLPLRETGAEDAFGLLVLGSTDLERFTEKMGTDFLVKIAHCSSAALSRLFPLTQ